MGVTGDEENTVGPSHGQFTLFFPIGVKLGTSFSLLWYVSQIHSSLSSRLKGTYSPIHSFHKQLLNIHHVQRVVRCCEWDSQETVQFQHRHNSVRCIKCSWSICIASGPGVIRNPDTPWKICTVSLQVKRRYTFSCVVSFFHTTCCFPALWRGLPPGDDTAIRILFLDLWRFPLWVVWECRENVPVFQQNLLTLCLSSLSFFLTTAFCSWLHYQPSLDRKSRVLFIFHLLRRGGCVTWGKFCSIHQFEDIWFVFTFWLLQIRLLETFMQKLLWRHRILFPSGNI